jgi:hypothetical protein
MVCVIVGVVIFVGVGTVLRMPLPGRDVTTLLFLKVMNSGESARIPSVQLPSLIHGVKPALTMRILTKKSEGITDTLPFHE